MAGVLAQIIVPKKEDESSVFKLPEFSIIKHSCRESDDGCRMITVNSACGLITLSNEEGNWAASVFMNGLDDSMPLSTNPERMGLWECQGNPMSGNQNDSIAIAILESSRIFGNHSHLSEDESWFVLEGTGKMVFGEPGIANTFGFRSGSYFRIPRGFGHAVQFESGIAVIYRTKKHIDDSLRDCKLI